MQIFTDNSDAFTNNTGQNVVWSLSPSIYGLSHWPVYNMPAWFIIQIYRMLWVWVPPQVSFLPTSMQTDPALITFTSHSLQSKCMAEHMMEKLSFPRSVENIWSPWQHAHVSFELRACYCGCVVRSRIQHWVFESISSSHGTISSANKYYVGLAAVTIGLSCLLQTLPAELFELHFQTSENFSSIVGLCAYM